jgi:hypothetical protein
MALLLAAGACPVGRLRADPGFAVQRVVLVGSDGEAAASARLAGPAVALRVVAGAAVGLRWRRDGAAWSPWLDASTDGWLDATPAADEVAVRSDGGGDVVLECRFLVTAVSSGRPVDGDVVERDEWGALPPAGPYVAHAPVEIVLHHSWRPSRSQYEGAATVRGIQRFHQRTQGWDDVGYHYLVGPDGVVFRGRPDDAVGAHCVPNSGKLGICILGDYDPDADELTDASWLAVRTLVLRIAGRYDIGPEELTGHRDYSPKTCPGERVYERIPELRIAVDEGSRTWPMGPRPLRH